MIIYDPAEIEASRQEVLRRLFGEILHEEGFGEAEVMIDPSDYTTGTLGYHEAIHTAKLVANLIDNDLMDHPTVALNSDAYTHAVAAHTALINLALVLIDEQDENP